MTKKIAILTQPLKSNYGGIIQNYALQKVLKNMGHYPITVNRMCSIKSIKAKVLNIMKHSKCLIYVTNKLLKRNYLTHKNLKKLYKHNKQFIKNHITVSKEIYNTPNLLRYFDKECFYAVIVGSDQTWRPKYSPNIYNYFLDFLENNDSIKKIAYASSFGTDEWEYTEEETKKCKKLTKRFDVVSVREDSGVRLCEEYLESFAVYLLDPTLLLTAEDYNKLIKKSKESKGLFFYILDDTEDKINFIQKCSEQLDLKLSKVKALYVYNGIDKRSLEDLIIPPLEDWLQGFRDAEFVITDSFHGTVFSIINKKPFITIVNKERGQSRFESLLNQLGLVDRLVYDTNDFDLLKKNIDYTEVEEKLNALKEKSLNFIKENL